MMTTKRTQGAQANLNGKIFEQQCLPLFIEHGFVVYKNKDYQDIVNRNLQLPKKYVVCGYPFISIYGHKGKTEFVIVDGNRRIRVEDKYQAAPGSVDEKFPYMYLNAVEAYPENEIILVVDGEGYKPEARQWLINAVKNNYLNYKEKGKDIKVMKMIEFTNWFNRNW